MPRIKRKKAKQIREKYRVDNYIELSNNLATISYQIEITVTDTYHINISTIFNVTLNKQPNQATQGFPSSPRVCKIMPQTTENVRTPKRFAELYFS